MDTELFETSFGIAAHPRLCKPLEASGFDFQTQELKNLTTLHPERCPMHLNCHCSWLLLDRQHQAPPQIRTKLEVQLKNKKYVRASSKHSALTWWPWRDLSQGSHYPEICHFQLPAADFPVSPLKDDIQLKNCLFILILCASAILVKFTKNGLDHTGFPAAGEAPMREKPRVWVHGM